jgi:hypothetical protein
MTYQEFDQRFTEAMEQDRAFFDSLTVSELIEWIKANPVKWRFQAWYSLGDRAKPHEVNDLLLSFLESDAAYLDRYHCAAAFIKVNQLRGIGPVMLSGREGFPVDDNLRKVRADLSRD